MVYVFGSVGIHPQLNPTSLRILTLKFPRFECFTFEFHQDRL